MMYYANEFNKPNTDEWQYAIWKIKKIGKSAGGLLKYEWVKKIYDPTNRFRVRDAFDINPVFVSRNERQVVQRIFEGKK